MDLNRLTQKSQQAVQEAQSKALRYGHVEIDGEHLLLALLEQQDGLLPRLLARMEVPLASLKGALEQALRASAARLRSRRGSWQNLRHPASAKAVCPG